jgi:hypothetical protein
LDTRGLDAAASASRISRAVANRCAGRFSRARASTALAGSFCGNANGAGSKRCLRNISTLPPSNSRFPVNIS